VVGHLLYCVQLHMETLSDDGLTMMLWGLRQLQYVPRKSWIDR
jgi:hypothetical protein